MLAKEMQRELGFIRKSIDQYVSAGSRIFASSSFQTHSIPMLHMISQTQADIPIYFVNTGFHFPETFQFRDEIAAQLKLSVISVSSPIDKIQQRAQDGSFIFMKDPDHCCHMNKVLPLEPILQNHDIWINGIRKDQTDFRESLRHEEKAPFNTLRFHPMLNWTSQMIWAYRQHFNLPAHPLEEKGYFSIGCMPCSRSFVDSPAERSGRWHGLKKTECGIHTELTQK